MNQQGRPEEAHSYLRQAIEILQQYPDITLEATYYSVPTDINHAQGHWSEAFEHVEKTLEF